MKNLKNILCLFNLLFFLGSFFIASVNSFSNSSYTSDFYHSSHHLSSKENITVTTSQLLIEENDNETEDGVGHQVFYLPFLISYLNLSSIELSLISSTPFLQKLVNPIYLSICNFRI